MLFLVTLSEGNAGDASSAAGALCTERGSNKLAVWFCRLLSTLNLVVGLVEARREDAVAGLCALLVLEEVSLVVTAGCRGFFTLGKCRDEEGLRVVLADF